MKIVSVLMGGLRGDVLDLARAAAAIAFPWARVTVLERAEAASDCALEAGCLWVLEATADSKAKEIAAATDSEGLPRWPVVAITAGTRDPEFLAYQFRATAEHHRLSRENARLRGDLRTLTVKVNHDLRSPLGFIYSYVDILRTADGIKSSADPKLVQSLANSVDEITRLLERVNLIARASVQPSALERVDMADVVSLVLQRIGHREGRAEAKLHAPDSWPAARGVPAWIEAIWQQLIENALAHAGKNPQIELGWSRVGSAIRFWVADDGPGLPPGKLAGIFPPFHCLSGTDSPRGLGLAIVRRLVEMQEGACGCEPAGERGARFYFSLLPA